MATEYILGQVVVVADLITNPTSTPTPNVPTDDNTDVVTIYKPDGTLTTPTVIHGANGSGAYSAQITVDQSGWWEYVWKSTSAGAGAGRGRFWVSPVP